MSERDVVSDVAFNESGLINLKRLEDLTAVQRFPGFLPLTSK